jgi:hypothetical protein
VAMRLAILALPAMLLPAQDYIPARPAPGDYKAHAVLSPEHTLAAEFLSRTVPAPNAAFILQHYVVVEVALFTRDYEFRGTRLSLRLNGKTPALAQTPGMVAMSLKYPSFENRRQMTAVGSVGNAGVVLGRDTASRFPGDRRVPRPPPGTPVTEEPSEEPAPWDWVSKLAWEDGPVKGPVGGLLYFPYKGNLAKLKTIELIYNGPEGLVTLALRESGAPPAKSAAPARTP